MQDGKSASLTERTSIPAYSITHYGVACRIPIFQTPLFSVAMLFCSDVDGYLGLLLTRCPDSPDQSRPLYHIGWNVMNETGDYRTIRLLNWGHDLSILRFAGERMVFEWKQIYLAHRLPPEPKPVSRSVEMRIAMPFRVVPSAFTELMRHGWEAFPRTHIPHSWTESRTIDLIFQCPGPGSTHAILALGRCPRHEEPHDVSWSHWANLWISPTQAPQEAYPPPHNCLQDHISQWPNQARLFETFQGGYVLPVVICFAPCPRNPEQTLVLSQVRFGRRYPFGRSWFVRPPILNGGR